MPFKTRKHGSRRQRGKVFYSAEDPKVAARQRAMGNYKNVIANQGMGHTIKEVHAEIAKESRLEKHEGEGYQGWTNWDTWETMPLLDNTESTNRWLDSWSKNFKQKIKGGRFNLDKAESVVHKYLVPVARGTKKMWFGKDLSTDSEIDPKKVNAKEIVANLLTRED